MQPITAQQSRDARRELGLSQADVTKALGLNRQYLSEFETGFSTRLTTAQLKKLRSFYEEKISEAKDNGDEIELTFGEPESTSPPLLETYVSKRLSFQVADEVSDDTFASTLNTITSNDKRLVELLTSKVNRDSALFGEGELSADTLEALRESFDKLAANYLLIRTLAGWPDLGLAASNINPAADSVLSLLISQVSDSFKSANILVNATEEDGEEVEQ